MSWLWEKVVTVILFFLRLIIPKRALNLHETYQKKVLLEKKCCDCGKMKCKLFEVDVIRGHVTEFICKPCAKARQKSIFEHLEKVEANRK